MKKIFAIAMLVLLLFNLGGYQLLFQYFIYKSDSSITEQINNNRYKATDLIEVKIPVHLNIDSWDDFKPISGQVTQNNIVYNYAELKLTRDTMYLKCIPNNDKAHLVNAKVTYSKEVNDIPVNKKSHDPILKKANTLSEYNLHAFKYGYAEFATFLKTSHRSVSYQLHSPFLESPGKPPNFIA